MTCLAKHAPLENLRSCDRSMKLPSFADGCLAGEVYLDVFTSWCVLRIDFLVGASIALNISMQVPSGPPHLRCLSFLMAKSISSASIGHCLIGTSSVITLLVGIVSGWCGSSIPHCIVLRYWAASSALLVRGMWSPPCFFL